MAKSIVADHDKFLKNQQINVEAKIVILFLIHFVQRIQQLLLQQIINQLVIQHHSMNIRHQCHFYDGRVPGRGVQCGGKGGTP